MNDWRDSIIQKLKENYIFLNLVSDPDKLLLDEKMFFYLKKENMELVNYDDPVQFRYVFETKYREEIEHRKTKIILRTDDPTPNSFPYDLLQIGVTIQLTLASIFSKLSLPILRQLDRKDLDALYTVYEQYQGSSSDKETLDFILKKVYKISLETINSATDFIKLLLSLHYRNETLPKIVEDFLIAELLKKRMLINLPIKEFITSSRLFYTFLQNEWPNYLMQLQETTNEVEQNEGIYSKNHFFSDPDVRRLLNDLFLERKLKPVEGFDYNRLPLWTHPGIIIDPVFEDKRRFKQLFEKLKENVQQLKNYRDWINFSISFGELKYLYLIVKETIEEDIIEKMKSFELHMEENFEKWVINNYYGLISLPYLPKPIMVHHIPLYLAAIEDKKIALLVLDGMNMVQWAQIKFFLDQKGFSFEEHGIFAWVPTLTSFSRQAIFSGNMPMYFSDSIYTTNKEELLWKTFWENHSLNKLQVSYEKGLGNNEYNKNQIIALRKFGIKVAGIVVNIIDELIHNAIQGYEGIVSELNIWLKGKFLVNLLRDLLDQGYSVYITSDHGNKESIGIGKLAEGILVETKGERVRIYKDRSMCKQASKKIDSIVWENVGLPNDIFVLLAKKNNAFIRENEKIISHGGISLEELIVPFIHVIKNDR